MNQYQEKDIFRLEKVFSKNDLCDVNYGDQWCVNEGKVIEKRTYPDVMSLVFLFKAPLGHQATFFRTSLFKQYTYREKYTISADRALYMELYTAGCKFQHIQLPIVYFDTEGIGSNIKTLEERHKQFHDIKREFFSEQVICDIESLMSEAENYKFVYRVAPLRWTYQFFRKIQQFFYKLR